MNTVFIERMWIMVRPDSSVLHRPSEGTSSVDALLEDLPGRVVTAESAEWDTVRGVFNLTTDLRPGAIVLPRTDQEVVVAVDRARELGLQVAPQATGHNAAAYGDLSGTVLLDLRHLRSVDIDVERRRVRVGAGVQWRDVVPQLSEHGLAALHGSSPLVGIAGYSLGGGIGWLSRSRGLQANSVIAFEVVTADGLHRRVDATHDPDLFWALRGGNGNFGVVTAIEFRVYPLPEVYAGALFFPAARSREVLGRWTALTGGFPDEMTTWASVIHFPDAPEIPEPVRGRRCTVLHAVLQGDEAEGRRLLADVRALGPAMDTFAMVPPAALADLAMDPPEPVPVSSTTALVHDLSPRTLDDLATVATDETSPLVMLQLRHLGGELARRRPGAGARATLEGAYCVFALAITTPETASAVPPTLARVDAAVRDERCGAYPNFVEEPAQAREFWDAESWARLTRIKSEVDPTGLFRGNHRVPGTEVG